MARKSPQVGIAQETAKVGNARTVGVPFPHEPRLSVCRCGHSGNTASSQHEAHFSAGHGRCRVEGCDCGQFTWAGRAENTAV